MNLIIQLVIDKRETDLMESLRKCVATNDYNFQQIQITSDVLTLGDIHINLIKPGETEDTTTSTLLCIIERKTVADLLASIKDGRYAEQSLRLSQNGACKMHNIVYLLEGTIHSHKISEKQIIYSSLTSLNAFKGFSVMRTTFVNETAEWLLCTADKIRRSMKNGKSLYSQDQQQDPQQQEQPNYCNVIKSVKKDNVTKDNIGEIMLMQIPGISAVLAKAILNHFHSFSDFFARVCNEPSCLDGLTYDCNGKPRKINSACLAKIKEFIA